MQDITEFLTEQLQSGGDGAPDVLSFALVLVVSIVFGLLMQGLYNLYYQQNEPQDGSLARSLVLLTPALTATFWMIQSSLVLSLGLLGSLSFVRFRTPVKRSEDVSFVIIAVAVAIACATGHFVIALALVALLFGYAILRNLVFLSGKLRDRFAVITFNTATKASASQVTGILAPLKIKAEFVSSRTYDGITSYVFNASKVSPENHDTINQSLAGLDRDAHINIFYPNDRLGA
jgi:hypothetical protein